MSLAPISVCTQRERERKRKEKPRKDKQVKGGAGEERSEQGRIGKGREVGEGKERRRKERR